MTPVPSGWFKAVHGKVELVSQINPKLMTKWEAACLLLDLANAIHAAGDLSDPDTAELVIVCKREVDNAPY